MTWWSRLGELGGGGQVVDRCGGGIDGGLVAVMVGEGKCTVTRFDLVLTLVFYL